MALRAAALEQPKPIKGDKVVSEYLEKLSLSSDEQLVVDDMTLRLAEGAKKYGSPLMTMNGRSADLDAYQELCDAIIYTIQGALEQADHYERQYRLDEAYALFSFALSARVRYLESIEVDR